MHIVVHTFNLIIYKKYCHFITETIEFGYHPFNIIIDLF